MTRPDAVSRGPPGRTDAEVVDVVAVNRSTSALRPLSVVVAVAALVPATACSSGGIDAVPAAAVQTAAVQTAAGQPTATEATRPAAAAPQEAAAPARDVPRWGLAVRGAATWSGTARYELRSRDGRTAAVTVTRAGERVRVDVTAEGLTSSLMTADAGWVACAQDGRTTCVTVADAGAELPAAWDPGVGRLVTTVVPGLDRRAEGMYADGYLVAGASGAAAACLEVVSGDPGRYCVTEQGLLRRAKFAGGTLTLVSADDTADPARFTPPTAPTALG